MEEERADCLLIHEVFLLVSVYCLCVWLFESLPSGNELAVL